MTRSTLRGPASRTLHPSLLSLKSGFLENARPELQSKNFSLALTTQGGRRLVCAGVCARARTPLSSSDAHAAVE